MDENCSVFPEANAEVTKEKCKRRQSGILKVSRSPLRTLNETDISQKMELVGTFRRSSRRVSFADTKEIKEFVTDKMMMQDDVENDEAVCMQNMEIHISRENSEKENQQEEWARDMMPQNTSLRITGMDALLHAPLRTPLQQLESCEPTEISKHQIFPISGLEVRKESEKAVTSSGFQKKIDFKSFLAGLDSTKSPCSNTSHDVKEELSNIYFTSFRQNKVPEHQKTIDFKSFLNRIKQTEIDENKMMPSLFEKQANFGGTSTCEAMERTNSPVFESHTINSLDANKTILFLDHNNDMEITKCHSALEQSNILQSVKEPNTLERPGSRGSLNSSLPQDKSVVIAERDCTTVTENVTTDVQRRDHRTNQNQPMDVTAKINKELMLPSRSPDEHAFTDYESFKKFGQNNTWGTVKLTSKSLAIQSGFPDKSQVFLNENDMDITKGHTVIIDGGSPGPVPSCTIAFPSDKTMVFSEENDMDLTQSCTVAIENNNLGQISNKALQLTRKSSRLSTPGSVLASSQNERTVIFSESNDMDITKSHTVTIDSANLGPVSKCTVGSSATFPGDKTMLFSEANDMDITQSCTVAIENVNLGQISNKALQSTRKSSRSSIPGSVLASSLNEKTVVFSEANDMDITKSHTVTIDSANLGSVSKCTVGSSATFPGDKTMLFSEANDMDITQSCTVAIENNNLQQLSNKALQSTRKSSRLSIPGSVLASSLNEKTVVFSEANDMDITKSHTVTIDSANLGSVSKCTVGSSATFPGDKTMVFSETNDMDSTQSCTVAIANDNLGQISNKALQSTRKSSRLSIPGSVLALSQNERTVIFSETNDMDITKSHTVTIDSANLGSVSKCTVGSSATFPGDKTMLFSEANDMDITQSCTVAIENNNLQQLSNKALQSTRKSSRLSIPGSVLASSLNEKTVVFSEANAMDITKSHTVTIDSANLGSVSKCTVGSSATFPGDKTILFSEANEMDITQSCTVAIENDNLGQVSNKALQSTRKSSKSSIPGSILASPQNEKTVVFSEANDMDITKSHTVTINSANLGSVSKCTVGSSATFPGDKTMVFSETNDMDSTQSCTVAIANDNLGQSSNKALQSTRKSSRLSIPESVLALSQNERTVIFSETNDMDITKSHTVTIDSANLGSVSKCTFGSSATFPGDKTMLFSEANDMDITQSCTVAIANDNLGQISNKALQSTRKSSRSSILGSVLASSLNEKTVVFSEANDMDITKSHTVTIDSANLGSVSKCTVGSSATFPGDKTMVFSETNDMDITQSCAVAIANDNLGQSSNKALQSTRRSSRLSIPGSVLALSQIEKTVGFSEENNMDVTKSHTGAIDSANLGPLSKCTVGSSATLPGDKTMLFSETNDMESTQSCAVAIANDNLGQSSNKALQSTRKSSRLSIPGSDKALSQNEKTVVFSEANDMDVTKSHTGAIDSGSLNPVLKCTFDSSATFLGDKTILFSKANDMDITQSCTVAIENVNLGQISNKALQSTRKSSRLSIPGSFLALSQNERTVKFSETNVMDITKSHTVTIDSANLGPVSKCTVGSSATFPGDKTMLFSKANDMDITQSCTVAIENIDLGHISNKALQSTRKSSRSSIPGSVLASSLNEKTVVFSEANDMDVSKSHKGPIDSGSLSPVSKCTVGSSANFPSDKTMDFSEANDKDITQSQTVAFEVGNLKLSGNRMSGSTKMTSTRSNNLACLSDEKSRIFSKVNEEDISPSHTVAIGCMKLGAIIDCAVGSSGDTMVISEANDMDETRSHTVAIKGECHGPFVKLTIGSADSFPHDKTTIFSKANDMDVNKSCTINVDGEKPGTIADGILGSAKMTSNLNAVGSVLSSFSRKKSMVFKKAAVTKNDMLLDHRKCSESAEHTVTKMTLENGQMYFSNQIDNTDCGNLEADSMCIMDPCEKNNLKASNQSLLCTENSSDMTINHTSDVEVQKETLIGKIREVTSEDFVQYQVPDSATCETRTESASATNNNQGCNTPRKSSLSDESSLQKLNSMTNVNADSGLEKPPLDGSGPAYYQIFNAKPCFLKQNSLFKDTLISQISHGVFLPNLPSRKNICRSGNTIYQSAVKLSVEHLCSDSLLNTMDKSEEVLNVFGPINNCQEQLEGQNKMQVTDCDKEESKMFDCLNPSHCLKSSKVHSLAIHEQQCKETLTLSEKDLDSTDQVLAHSGIISTVEQKPFQKRVCSEKENGNACSKRKMMRTLEYEGTDFSKKEISITPVVPWESAGHETVEENLLSMTTKSLDSNSSLDSTKADGTSAHAITPKYNLKSSLMILEESELHKKLMDGNITVREFFMLLKVQTHAQKSRQSELQVNPELDKSSELENWLAVKFVHRPKREVYEEDSAALSTAINDLKDHLLDLDKLLSEVNLPLLKEVMQMTKQELQQLRSCLNTKKATFVKMTKVICLEQKVQLYSSQLNALKAQHQQKKEYEDSLDDLLCKMDDCLASLDLGNLDQVDVINSDENLMELEQSVNERREVLRNLQEEHSKMESQLAEVLDEKLLQEKAVKMLELNEEFQELLEWKLLPCQDDKAVYGFLYDSLELTLQNGEPACADFSPGGKCRKILDIKLVSELDEEAPAHSKLVHELIMTYWKNQDSWHTVHANESEIPMLLLDLSLVVSRCRLFGDELEYLLKWGSKFDILKTVIQHTDVKFLISSYDALSKFEVTFHITPGYPWVPLQFTFNSRFGKISGEHINEVLLTVKPGHKYLIRIMKHLYLTLLIKPGADRFHTQHAFS